MTVTATPTLTVAGQPVQLSYAGTALVAVDQLTVTWGRTSLLEHPTAARAALVVRDRTAARTFAARRDLIGQPVVLGWSCSDGSSGVNFRGRITDVEVTPHITPGQTAVTDLDVALTCSSLELDCANYLQPQGTVWPSETFTARSARIAALLPSGLFAAAPVLHPDWTAATAAQLDVSDADALSLLRTLYASTARPLIYDPAANRFTYGPRRYVAAGAAGGDTYHSAALVAFPDRGGRLAASASPVSGSWLNSASLSMSAAGQGIEQRITRVAVNYRDSSAAWASATFAATVAGTSDEAVVGRRTLTVETVHSNASTAENCATQWASLCAAEAGQPSLSPVTFDTHRTPFADAAQAAALLAGAEAGTWYFLQGSWLPLAGVTPLVGIIRARINYRAGDWSIDLQPAPAVNSNATPGLVIRGAAATTATRLADLDESFTFADAAWTTVGAGYTPATMPLSFS